MEGRALVAWNLRRLRTAKGLSQERLAADAGLSRVYLNEVERELGNVTVDVMGRLAATLDCQIADLVRMPEEGEKRAAGLRSGRRPSSR